MDEGVALGAMIRQLRAELEQAAAAGEGADLLFGLGPIELELEMGVTSEGGGETGVKFWVLTLGGKASKVSERTQRLKLTLSPRRRSDPDADVYVRTEGVLGD